MNERCEERSAEASDATAAGVRRAGAFVWVAATGAYMATASKSALGGDGGEFAALSLSGGVAHPPGYPLFVLYLRAFATLFAWIPSASAAHKASLAAALLGGLAAWLLFRVSVAYGASVRAALLVTALFAASPLTWLLSTYPEVFVGNACLALAIAWLAAPSARFRGSERAFLLALSAGLGVSHHHSIVLVFPLGVVALLAAVRETQSRARLVVGSALGFSLGLLPYAYPWLAGRGALGADVIGWGDTGTWSGLVHHFLRRDYGTTSLGAGGRASEPLAHLTFLTKTLMTAFVALPLVFAASLLVARAVVMPAASSLRRPRLALLLAILVSGPLFVARFNIPPKGVGALIVERFHLLPAALLFVFVAPAFNAWLDALRPLYARIALAVALASSSTFALLALPEHHRPTVERYAENILMTLPEGAIVVGGGDHRAGSFLYAEARGIRRDVVFLQPSLLLSPAIHRRMSERLRMPLVGPVNGTLDAHALLTQLVRSERPIFVTDWPAPGLAEQFPSFPIGPVLRLVKERADVPPPLEVLRYNDELMGRMRLEDAPPLRGTWAGALAEDYARPWRALALAFAPSPKLAGECAERVQRLAPR